MSAVRFGVLGAAKILPTALVKPARRVGSVRVTTIAARDPERARKCAARQGIARVHDRYEAVLADPAVDAVYIPLPAALHARWTMAAVAAGKHVLCEKPFTANAGEAARVADASGGTGLVVMEAYHTGHHPLTARLRNIVDSGELGRVQRAEAVCCVPFPSRGNIRWQLELGGGGLLDVGYYPVRLLRDLFGEPTVRAARARHTDGIDRYLEADLDFEPDVRARVVSSIWSRRLFSTRLRVRGDRGSMNVSWPYHPQYGARITVRTPAGSRRERVDRRASYDFQLERFRDAVNGQSPCLTDTSAAVSQMLVLDEIYRASGLPERPSQT